MKQSKSLLRLDMLEKPIFFLKNMTRVGHGQPGMTTQNTSGSSRSECVRHVQGYTRFVVSIAGERQLFFLLNISIDLIRDFRQCRTTTMKHKSAEQDFFEPNHCKRALTLSH